LLDSVKFSGGLCAILTLFFDLVEVAGSSTGVVLKELFLNLWKALFLVIIEGDINLVCLLFSFTVD